MYFSAGPAKNWNLMLSFSFNLSNRLHANNVTSLASYEYATGTKKLNSLIHRTTHRSDLKKLTVHYFVPILIFNTTFLQRKCISLPTAIILGKEHKMVSVSA